VGENPPTQRNRPPTLNISPKRFFVEFSNGITKKRYNLQPIYIIII
jgi:hypothetical protein